MISISQNIKTVHQLIAAAEKAAKRPPDSVQLLAVSKQQSSKAIREAFMAGQARFGENYVQEALDKMSELTDLPIEWHFIGHMQTNKTRLVAENFAWVHTLDRESVATRLHNQRPTHLLPLQVCIEVNLANEPQKSGVAKTQLLALATHISHLPRLQLRGLMAIPPAEQTRQYFVDLANLKMELENQGFVLDTLSMGMSHDFQEAIAAGATIVRVGTAIFGER